MSEETVKKVDPKAKKPRTASNIALVSHGEDDTIKIVGKFRKPAEAWKFAREKEIAGTLSVVCFRGTRKGEVKSMFSLA